MKIFRIIILSLILIIPCSILASAYVPQDYKVVEVKISKEKVLRNGKVYYCHFVESKQTLYSIAKAYGVSLDCLYANNPQLKKEGLKNASVIFIPADKVGKATTVEKNPVKKDSIEKAPAKKLQAKAKEQNPTKVDTHSALEEYFRNQKEGKDYKNHRLSWFENIDDVALDYKVPADVILWYNQLTNKHLSFRTILKIPLHPEVVIELMKKYSPNKSSLAYTTTNTAIKSTSSINEAAIAKKDFMKSSAELSLKSSSKDEQNNATDKAAAEPGAYSGRCNISLFLPFDIQSLSQEKYRIEQEIAARNQAAKADTDSLAKASQDNDNQPVKEQSPTQDQSLSQALSAKILPDSTITADRSAMDFYSGILCYLQMNPNKAMNINLDVFDSKNADNLSLNNISNHDMVIGPFSYNSLEKIAQINQGESLIISPLVPRAKKLAAKYPDLVQAPPDAPLAQYYSIISWIKSDLKNSDKLVNIFSQDSLETNTQEFNQLLCNSLLPFRNFSYKLLNGRNVDKTLVNILDKNAVNRIVINSDDEGFVSDVLRNLNIIEHEKYKIVIYCLSKVHSFESIDVNNFHNLNAHFAMSYYIDYNSPEVKDFLMRYRAIFKCEPSQFAFQAYDIAGFFLKLREKYGFKFFNHISDEDYKGLQCNFDFRKCDNAGYLNYGIKRIVYKKNFTIKVLQ